MVPRKKNKADDTGENIFYHDYLKTLLYMIQCGYIISKKNKYKHSGGIKILLYLYSV